MRHPSLSLRRATVKVAPVCVTCLSCTLHVMDAGTTTYALSPLTVTCRGSPRVTTYPEAPCYSPSTNTSLYQSWAAVGPCHTCGARPSRIIPGTAKVDAIVLVSPLLKASTYWRTAATGSSVVILGIPVFWGSQQGRRGSRTDTVLRSLPVNALFPGHCIWSSMFEKAALSFSAFLISSALT